LISLSFHLIHLSFSTDHLSFIIFFPSTIFHQPSTPSNQNKITSKPNQKIDYTEFLAATMNVNCFIKEDNIRHAFNHFDRNNSGYFFLREMREMVVGG